MLLCLGSKNLMFYLLCLLDAFIFHTSERLPLFSRLVFPYFGAQSGVLFRQLYSYFRCIHMSVFSERLSIILYLHCESVTMDEFWKTCQRHIAHFLFIFFLFCFFMAEAVGFGDPLVAVLPAFHDIK